MMQLTGANQDTRLLWRLGYHINTFGCRRDLELAVIDMYLKGTFTDEDCEKIREIISGVDISIQHGLVYPRLKEITILINKINGIII